MDKTIPNLAARFFFKNCTISILDTGEISLDRVSRPKHDDVVIDRDFMVAAVPFKHIKAMCDFYKFINLTSISDVTTVRKLFAIGYMLCNKLPREGSRCLAFVCLNEDNGACCNGKTLFAKAVSQFCNSTMLHTYYDIHSPFWLSSVNEDKNLVIFDDLPDTISLNKFSHLCKGSWTIHRKCQEPLVISSDKIPYMLFTVNSTIRRLKKGYFHRNRFVILKFSSFFNQDNTVAEFFGHSMFDGWDSTQWCLFDNLMIYCVTQYLKYRKDANVFPPLD